MKLGIAGSGGIVNTCLETLAHLDFIDTKAICVRPQSRHKGEALAKAYGIVAVYTDYNAMLTDPDIDFIYIGLPNSLHYSYTKAALEAGRNVILEKPFTSTLEEAKELVALATKKQLYLLEAVTNLYSPVFRFVQDMIPKLGDIKLVQCNYSQYSSRYDRYLAGDVAPAFDPACSGGTLFDLNIYNLHSVIRLFGTPEQTSYIPNLGFNRIDTSGVAILRYKNFIATCAAAKDSESPSFVIVQGTKGYVKIHGAPGVCASAEAVIGGETFHSQPGPKLRMAPEFEAFETIWQSGDYARCKAEMAHSLAVMEVAEAARKSGGITFDADSE